MSDRQPPVDYIARTRAQYEAFDYPAYRWVENDDTPPWAPLSKPLKGCRVALIASGGIYAQGQVAFHFRDDLSFRAIDSTTDTGDLRATHFAYDLTDQRQDPNCVFPLDTLRRLAADGVIAGLTRFAYTFMGGIYSARKVRDRLAPEIRSRVLADGADLALLVPA